MAYDNNSDKVNYIKKTGTEVINNSYKIDVSSIIDSSNQLSTTLADKDELLVVRKFDASSISPAITADEAWSAWTLPDTDASGSSMYTISSSDIVLESSTFTWTTAQSGRAADVTLPAVAAADTIYVLRKVPNLAKLVNWTAGSKITANNLNTSADQLISLSQEL